MDKITLRRIGAALGVLLQKSGAETKRVIIGHDGRESAGWILQALAQGLNGTEVVVHSVGLTTTPALAYVTRTGAFVAGVMISASHNKATDNGVKIFSESGQKLADSAEREIEKLTLEVDMAEVTEPRIREQPELLNGYQEHLANLFNAIDMTGLRIAIDAAHGGGSSLAPQTLRMMGAEVQEVACSPTGTNINAGVGATHTEPLAAAMKSGDAHIGLALDGDGDRGMLVDETGVVKDGDDLLALFGIAKMQEGTLNKDTVVATVMSNLGLKRALSEVGAKIEMTGVGDRAVAERMRQGGFSVGGEQSGHLLFDGPGELTGDGLYTLLAALALPSVRKALTTDGGGAASAFPTVTRFPQILINVPVLEKPPFDERAAIVACRDEIEAELAEEGRVLLRYSGTESLCRVMVEGPEKTTVERLANKLAEVVRETLAN